MNVLRFAHKCLFNRRAAVVSGRLFAREMRAKWHWKLHPNVPLKFDVGDGAFLLLDQGHSFTVCIHPNPEGYEPDLRAYLHSVLHRDSVFLDCGANVGYFSVLARKWVGPEGRVISVEANPETVEILKRNLDLNGGGEIINLALTTTPGEVELHVPVAGDIYSSMKRGGFVKGPDIRSFKVQGATVDSVVAELNLTALDAIKIDVEGADLDVLMSARSTLERFRPHVSLEYATTTWPAFGASHGDLLKFLAQCHYNVGKFDLSEKRVIPIANADWASPYLNLCLTPCH